MLQELAHTPGLQLEYEDLPVCVLCDCALQATALGHWFPSCFPSWVAFLSAVEDTEFLASNLTTHHSRILSAKIYDSGYSTTGSKWYAG